jgi:hypothetical protein
MTTPDLAGFLDRYPRDVRPPEDDRPFYFLFTKARDLLSVMGRAPTVDEARLGDGPVPVLITLTAVTIALALLFVLGPMAARRLRGQAVGLRATGWDVALFVFIGVGFILVEIAQIQRLSLLLGHPSYSLSVVLATLLLMAGAGSLVSERFPWPQGQAARERRPALARLCALIVGALILVGALTPATVAFGAGLELPWRIALAVALLSPIGFCLGMVLPLGVRSMSLRNAAEVPWLWAINGAVSVFGSVLATMLSITLGIAGTYLIGTALYVLASIALLRISRCEPTH